MPLPRKILLISFLVTVAQFALYAGIVIIYDISTDVGWDVVMWTLVSALVYFAVPLLIANVASALINRRLWTIVLVLIQIIYISGGIVILLIRTSGLLAMEFSRQYFVGIFITTLSQIVIVLIKPFLYRKLCRAVDDYEEKKIQKKVTRIYSKFRSLKFETWISFLALLISAYSISSSEKQLELTRIHNKLSVRPKLEVNITLTEDQSFIGLEVANKGLGPAKILAENFSFNGGSFVSRWDEITTLIMDNDTCGMENPNWFQLNSSLLLPGEKQPLYYFPKDLFPIPDCAIESLRRIHVIIEYESLYGEKDTVVRRGKLP